MGDIHSFGSIHPTAVVHDAHLSIFLQPEQIMVHEFARIDGLVKLQGGQGLIIGAHCHIASFCALNAGGGLLKMGDHSGCSNGVVIAGGQPDLTYQHISAADAPHHLHPLRKETNIGRHVVIFANATILPGVTIGSYAVVAAGAVVTKDVPPYTVVMGVPARVVGRRVPIDDGMMRIEWLPKLRDLAAQRDIERVRAHYGLPEDLAVDLVEFVDTLTEEMTA